MNSKNSESIITTSDMPHDAVFQSQVIHEASGTMVVGPLFDKDKFADAIGLSVFVIAVAVLVILIDTIVARMMAEFVDTLFLPDFDMVRFTAFGQHPRLKITNGYQADTTAETGSIGEGYLFTYVLISVRLFRGAQGLFWQKNPNFLINEMQGLQLYS